MRLERGRYWRDLVGDTREGRSSEATAFRRQQEHLKCIELAREN